MDSPMDQDPRRQRASRSQSLTSLLLKILAVCKQSRRPGCRPCSLASGTAPPPPSATSGPRLDTKDGTHLLRGVLKLLAATPAVRAHHPAA